MTFHDTWLLASMGVRVILVSKQASPLLDTAYVNFCVQLASLSMNGAEMFQD